MSRMIFFFFLLVIAGVVCKAPINAQQKPSNINALNIAVLNMLSIRRNALVILDINKQISEGQKIVREGIKKEENTLRIANQDLAKKRPVLSPEAYTLERKKFEQNVIKVQRLVQKRKQDLNKAKISALGKVEKTINQIITEIAKERGYLIILGSDQTILSSKKLDITAEVLKRLNKVLSVLKVRVSK